MKLYKKKKGMAVVTIVAIIIGILFLVLYFAGLGVGFGVINILRDIPWWGWIIIFIIIFRISSDGKKK